MEKYIQIGVISLRSPTGKVIDTAPIYKPAADVSAKAITTAEAATLDDVADIVDKALQKSEEQ
jgi:hypothetical protein